MFLPALPGTAGFTNSSWRRHTRAAWECRESGMFPSLLAYAIFVRLQVGQRRDERWPTTIND
jgi:hypothetical protein